MKRVSISNCIQQYRYPNLKKYPTTIKYFFYKGIVIAVFFMYLITVSSCKTCKCPAYSQKYEIGQCAGA
jgi:hypothetical protein